MFIYFTGLASLIKIQFNLVVTILLTYYCLAKGIISDYRYRYLFTSYYGISYHKVAKYDDLLLAFYSMTTPSSLHRGR
jgi:hypothetical protein